MRPRAPGTARAVLRVAAIAAVAASMLVGCGGQPPRRGHFSISPKSAQLDAPVSVALHDVDPHAKVTITASATDRTGVRWSSNGTFVASVSGVVSLADSSVAGSYRGRSPMGLFELMKPASGSSTLFLAPDAGYDVSFTARVGSTTVASTSARREDPRARGVTSRPFTVASSNSVQGMLYLPKQSSTKHPAVLVFGGSDGGESRDFSSRLLAGHGYPALSIAYFDAPGLPKQLQRIPLEYFVKALRVLAAAPGVDRSRIFVDGGSRGSEAALLLGVHFPDLVYGVIAGSPSDHVSDGIPGPAPAWTLGGRPVPRAPDTDFQTPHPADAPASIIDVAAIRGPVMTICGQQDLLWPSCDFAASIRAERRAATKAAHDVYLSYTAAGHAVASAARYYSQTEQATAGDGLALGGSVPADLAASADAHSQVLRFLAASTR
jgi:dienelactone hydrolase